MSFRWNVSGRNSSLLEITDRKVSGRDLHRGRTCIIHAVDRRHDFGEAGLSEIARCSPAALASIPAFEAPPARSIEGQWEFLLMEAARVHDESARADARGLAAGTGQDAGSVAPGGRTAAFALDGNLDLLRSGPTAVSIAVPRREMAAWTSLKKNSQYGRAAGPVAAAGKNLTGSKSRATIAAPWRR